MITKGHFQFSKNTVLDESSIKELHKLLLEYCSAIDYEAKTQDEKNLEFESCDELLAYDNFKKGKIIELKAIGHTESNRIFDFTFYGKRFSTPYIECFYSFSGPKIESSFCNDLTKFFDKAVESNTQHLITSLIIGVLFLAGYLYLVLKNDFDTGTIVVLAIFESAIYALIENRLLKSLFPPVVFCWGEENKKHASRKSLRSNLFWCVIVATFISIVVGVVLNLLL